MSSANARKNVVIIGCGVVGLTTAITIQEKGDYDVTIIAELFPGDPKSIRYTSNWAGGHHVSHATGDPRMRKIDEDTLKVMWDLSAPGGAAEGCFLRIQETEYFYDGRDAHLDWMPDVSGPYVQSGPANGRIHISLNLSARSPSSPVPKAASPLPLSPSTAQNTLATSFLAFSRAAGRSSEVQCSTSARLSKVGRTCSRVGGLRILRSMPWLYVPVWALVPWEG